MRSNSRSPRRNKSGRPVNLPPWNNRANVTFSKDNHAYHTQYREFFDKNCGRHQYTDQFKYIYKTPSNGNRDFGFFENKSKYYWEMRQPVNPDSPKKHVVDYVRNGYVNDFEVMYSKNNHHRHPSKREFFDKPINYIHKGFLFSPKYKMPLDLYDNGESHFNLKTETQE